MEWLEVEPKEREMNKFKVGDMVVCKKKYKGYASYFDTPKKIEGYGILGLVLVGEVGGFMSEKYLELAKMNKFKVGDYVKCLLFKIDGSYFENVLQVEEVGKINKRINPEGNCCVSGRWYPVHVLELVCGFTKGQMIEVSEYFSEEFVYTEEFLFYYPNLEKPFVTIDSDKNVSNWKYARAIQPEYKAYSEPKVEWIGKPMLNKKTGKRYSIRSIAYYGEVLAIETYEGLKYTMQEMFNEWTWLDGTPCGELL